MDYHIFREIADSWVLLAMFLFFLGAVAFVFRPGARKTHEDTANIPFRHENAPVADGEETGAALKEARQ